MKPRQYFTRISQSDDGMIFTTIPRKVAEFNRLHKGMIIQWSEGYSFPHIERILTVEEYKKEVGR